MPLIHIRVNNDIAGGTVEFSRDETEIMARDGDTSTALEVISLGLIIERFYYIVTKMFSAS